MSDMSEVIIPKSDQWNADDFITGPQTFTIRDVEIRKTKEQPVQVFFEGSDKAYRPCKSMCRVLVHAWGRDAKEYVGRSLALYCDPSVTWAGVEVGGIRISHLSHITAPMQVQLTKTRGSKKPFVVAPLNTQAAPVNVEQLKAQALEQAAFGKAMFTEHWQRLNTQQQRALKPFANEFKAACEAADGKQQEREPGGEG